MKNYEIFCPVSQNCILLIQLLINYTRPPWIRKFQSVVISVHVAERKLKEPDWHPSSSRQEVILLPRRKCNFSKSQVKLWWTWELLVLQILHEINLNVRAFHSVEISFHQREWKCSNSRRLSFNYRASSGDLPFLLNSHFQAWKGPARVWSKKWIKSILNQFRTFSSL